VISNEDRVRGALIGQAVGDALGAPTEGLSREQIYDRFGWVDDFVSSDPAGTDDTEYSVVTAQLLLEHGHGLTAADVTVKWRTTLVEQVGGFSGGGFSEMTAINHLREGLSAPETGTDNHEMWSDGTAMRVGPIGAYCSGDPAEAARLAGIDASVSHARDGVLGGQLVAASVASAAGGASSIDEIVEAGLAQIPADSWTNRTVREAIAIAASSPDMSSALDGLTKAIVIHHYPWADAGPEAVGLAFGLLVAAQGRYEDAVLAAVNIGRDSDTIAAIVGAIAGAAIGYEAIPQRWSSRVLVVRGDCIAATAGTNLLDLADQLSARSKGAAA
jgi:ADP-ribosylglycohydrolase